MATCALMTKQTIKRLLVSAVALTAPSVAAQTVKIVGIGASSCAQFTREIGPNSSTERDYFAWAQGFMSGVLAQAPLGVDEGLDLDPPSLALPAQAAFLIIATQMPCSLSIASYDTLAKAHDARADDVRHQGAFKEIHRKLNRIGTVRFTWSPTQSPAGQGGNGCERRKRASASSSSSAAPDERTTRLSVTCPR